MSRDASEYNKFGERAAAQTDRSVNAAAYLAGGDQTVGHGASVVGRSHGLIQAGILKHAESNVGTADPLSLALRYSINTSVSIRIVSMN